jgi:hypothetical protein
MTGFEATGGCLCGAVRFRITAKTLMSYYCHCTMCQRTTCGPFQTAAKVPIKAFAFSKGETKAYKSSPGFVRLSCGECGSALSAQAKDNPKLASVHLGCLDDPNAIRPEFHTFTSTQVSWCEVADGLPRHAELGPELDKLWVELEGWQPVD